MSICLLGEPTFQNVRASLVYHAIDHKDFRHELSKALTSKDACPTEDLSIGDITRRSTQFASGLWRANRVAFYGDEYEGTPSLSDGGDRLSPATLLTTLEDIEYNTSMALPARRKARFDLRGWGGHPETALQLYHRVSLACVELWDLTKPRAAV